ncbi:MAG TPA: hypothetical protein VFT95_03195 [Micromonosporaceae bacterium]|nr:hypothetical protein [Micromonosporaceae bacterium]
MSVLPDLADWTVARLIDARLKGDDMPGWAPLLGIVFIVAAAVTLTWLAVRALERRVEERNLPTLGSLLDARPWLAEEGVEVPARYRGRRRARVVPAHPLRAVEPVTQVIPRVSDEPDATITIPKTYGGTR